MIKEETDSERFERGVASVQERYFGEQGELMMRRKGKHVHVKPKMIRDSVTAATMYSFLDEAVRMTRVNKNQVYSLETHLDDNQLEITLAPLRGIYINNALRLIAGLNGHPPGYAAQLVLSINGALHPLISGRGGGGWAISEKDIDHARFYLGLLGREKFQGVTPGELVRIDTERY